MRRHATILVAGLLLCGSGILFAQSEPPAAPPVRLDIEPGDLVTRVFVERDLEDGSTERVLLRETPDAVVAVAAGTDPRGRAAFATWNEGADARWYAFRRASVGSWSEPRRLATTLRLRDASVAPEAALPAALPGLAAAAEGRLHLVQFRTVALPEWRRTLDELGVETLQFFPHNAYIARLAPGVVERVAALEFVERVAPYQPSYRVEASLRAWLDAPAGDAVAEKRVRVQIFGWGDAAKQAVLSRATPLGVRPADYWPSGHVVELWVTRDQLRQVAAFDDVMWIDPWTPAETDMDLVREDAGTNWLETNFSLCGQGVNGEVMDNGIQQNHQDFDGIVMHTTADQQSHGTNTFGIVFGNGDRDGDGNAQGTGHMPCEEAQGIFADYNNVSDRFAHTQELKASPYFAAFQTNSWGSSRTTSYTSVSSEMDDIIWQLDILILQSQSNSGNQSSRPQAWAKNIVSVGGIRHFNTLDTSDDAWNSGASIGPAEDGRIKPDINYWYDSIYTTTTGGGYTTGFGGTSAATPEAAGVVGLLAQLWSENAWNTNPVGNSVFEKLPHASTLKALTINNANQYAFSGSNDDLTRVHQGWGRPSVRLARERAARSLVVDEEVNLQLGQSATYDVVVDPGETELKITMVYPDPPGTTSSTLHRINDLNLRVLDPGGTTYHGNNGLDTANYSSSGGTSNDVDTVENVFIQNPAAGTWTVIVEAEEINQDAVTATPAADATFALVVTGAVQAGSCGDGVRDPGEECDGLDLGGAGCVGVGCSAGTLSCNVDCTYDNSTCSGCPVCGDGLCELGEDCAGCAADCISASAAVCGNGICEAADGEDCTTCDLDCNGAQTGKPDNRYCCGAGGGTNPVPCSDSRCNGSGNICTDAGSYAYCCGDAVCEGAETPLTCDVDCAPPAPSEVADTPPEALWIATYDAGTQMMNLDFGPACGSIDSVIAYGELTRENLAAYTYVGEQCAVGTSGSYSWDTSGAPQSFFFIIYGQNASGLEGSYGKDHAGQERPSHLSNVTCPSTQDLTNVCGG